jgi:hypothetical protein
MVDEALLDRPFLESLTTAELVKLADRAGIDVPPGLERIVIIGALLETVDGVEEDVAPAFLPEEKRLPASTAPLPRHYNITYLNVLVRDPLWAFAFWEINARDRELHEKAGDFGGYCLRVEPYPKPVEPRSKAGRDSSFTVQVGTGDSAWYLGFSSSGGTFQVKLTAIRREQPVILAISEPFMLPNLHEPLGNRYSKASHNPLLRLSGIDDFKILRDTSRLSRLPKHSTESVSPGFDAGKTGAWE